MKNTISQSKTYNKDIEWLFTFTQDFRERVKWDLQTKEIGFLDEHSKLKNGARVYTKSAEGIYMETLYLTFHAPHEISIKMDNTSSIFKDFLGKWKYESNGIQQTTLTVTYQFNLKFPYTLFHRKVKKRISNNIAQKLDFLQRHLLSLQEY